MDQYYKLLQIFWPHIAFFGSIGLLVLWLVLNLLAWLAVHTDPRIMSLIMLGFAFWNVNRHFIHLARWQR